MKRSLSGVINFAKFREEKLMAYMELQEGVEALKVQRQEAEAKLEGLRATLGQMQEARAGEEPVRGVWVVGGGGGGRDGLLFA